MVQEAASEVRRLFVEHGVSAMPKTTGNRGIHIYVRLEPRWTSYEVRSAAVAVARELERRRPELMTAAWWKEERGERVFIDFNQNAPHKTIFGAWSVRARPGAQVSTPFVWDELDTIHPDELTIATVPERVRAHGDPWRRCRRHRSRSSPCWLCTNATPRRGYSTPLAAGVSEDAGRAAACGTEPGQEGARAGVTVRWRRTSADR